MPPSKRRKKSPDPADDWKSTLFSWCGLVEKPTEDEAPLMVTWKGAWVGVGHGEERPSTEEHASSPNTFALKFEVDTLPWSPTARVYCFEGSYLLDQGDGDGLQEYSDHTHRVAFGPAAGDGTRACAAVGTTEFAPFVSYGELSKSGWLSLSRRYLDTRDERCGWSPEEVLGFGGDRLAWERLGDIKKGGSWYGAA